MTYSPAFLDAVTNLLRLEGGYVNDPSDPGGETNFGISKRAYPRLDIKTLPMWQAIDIYYTDWWTKFHFDQLSAGIGKKMLDMSVNLGIYHATKLLQLALLAEGVEVVVDGMIGPATRAACNTYAAQDALLYALRYQDVCYYKT